MRPIFTYFGCARYCLGRGSVLLWGRYDTLCISGFVYNVTFAHNTPRGGKLVALQRAASLHRRAQANASAAS